MENQVTLERVAMSFEELQQLEHELHQTFREIAEAYLHILEILARW